MGSLHLYHAAHHRILHQLPATAEEGHGYPRDRHLHLCRFVTVAPDPSSSLVASNHWL